MHVLVSSVILELGSGLLMRCVNMPDGDKFRNARD